MNFSLAKLLQNQISQLEIMAFMWPKFFRMDILKTLPHQLNIIFYLLLISFPPYIGMHEKHLELAIGA